MKLDFLKVQKVLYYESLDNFLYFDKMFNYPKHRYAIEKNWCSCIIFPKLATTVSHFLKNLRVAAY